MIHPPSICKKMMMIVHTMIVFHREHTVLAVQSESPWRNKKTSWPMVKQQHGSQDLRVEFLGEGHEWLLGVILVALLAFLCYNKVHAQLKQQSAEM